MAQTTAVSDSFIEILQQQARAFRVQRSGLVHVYRLNQAKP